MPKTPEQLAREHIDPMLEACGWVVQDMGNVDLSVSRGVAVTELSFTTGEPDYTLYADNKVIGAVEAKPEGHTLSGVEVQSAKYAEGVPFGIPHWKEPLPFSYESTGLETWFVNRLDPVSRSRQVFAFHRPETLVEWVQQEKQLAQRLREFPKLEKGRLWDAQFEAIVNLEKSLAAGKPRSLIQMATGSGKTFTAVNFIYRLIKYAGARRVLFLVDRGNLGRQTFKEFQQFVSPVNNYKFTEEYNVQRLTGNVLDTTSRVVIGTIQRLYSMLKGEEAPPEDLDDMPIDAAETLYKEPVPVEYNPAIPVETFDFIVTDECHRSIYNLWRQVLEYFDAKLIGLTATPSKQTIGFFNQNLVMEYGHDKAVVDGVNVGCDVYRIQTSITEHGSTVDAGFYVDKRDRQTREIRWEQLDEELAYDGDALDRDVVAVDQIRTVLTAFRDRLFVDLFPGREDVPKTLIFAKDDSHADDIVRICREVFERGNDFCKKITYKTTGETPEALLQKFRNSYDPRIAVTVDMVATGTDIKPLEIVFFMRSVRSRNYFDQMKGRGVRVISETEMEQVNPGVKRKTRFMIVDAVGVCERIKTETRPLESKRTVSFEKLLDAIALGNTEPEALESLAGRLLRLERRLDEELSAEVIKTSRGQSLSHISKKLVDAVDPDVIEAAVCAKAMTGTKSGEKDVEEVAKKLAKEAIAPLASNPELRNLLKKIQKAADQIIDVISKDAVLYAGPASQGAQNAAQLVMSFREYIIAHQAEIDALQILYSRPYHKRLTEPMLKELEQNLRTQNASWNEEQLWQAFAAASPNKVKGRSAMNRFADLVPLVRFALEQQPSLEPFADSVRARFDIWVERKAVAGVRFTSEQRAWLERIRDHIATTVSFVAEDFEGMPFNQMGGLGKAHKLFGKELSKLLDELNEVLAA